MSKNQNSKKSNAHLKLNNLGKIFYKEKKFFDFYTKGNRSGFEAVSYTHLRAHET